ncbi:hypothetical protein D7V91_12345 [bacterium 1xD42-67]|nr:hypothetical protein D7V91_12345 [bacterium 1xD42-67]
MSGSGPQGRCVRLRRTLIQIVISAENNTYNFGRNDLLKVTKGGFKGRFGICPPDADILKGPSDQKEVIP